MTKAQIDAAVGTLEQAISYCDCHGGCDRCQAERTLIDAIESGHFEYRFKCGGVRIGPIRWVIPLEEG